MSIKRFDSEVLEIEKLENDVIKLFLPVDDDFEFIPGQFVTIFIPQGDKLVARQYSIALNAEREGKKAIELCIKLIEGGTASEFFRTIKKGDKLQVLGPGGVFKVKPESKEKDITFIATGTGIVPFVCMIEDLLKNNFQNKITLIKGTRYESGTLYDDFFKELSGKYPNFQFHNIISRPETPDFKNKGYVQDFLESHVPEIQNTYFYICGLNEMIKAVSEKLISLGVDNMNIYYEKYD